MYTLIEKIKMFLKHINNFTFIKLIYRIYISGKNNHKYQWETNKTMKLRIYLFYSKVTNITKLKQHIWVYIKYTIYEFGKKPNKIK
jgi:hypothetical protein